MTDLEEKLEYKFSDISLLVTALTHSSYANERKKMGIECNERLEFLGDSVLGMVTAEFLFRNELGMPEGKMTRLRAELVCERSLAEAADELELGRHLLLGKGEDASGGRNRPSIKADAMEAVLAAMYLDGGIENAKKVIYKHILAKLDKVVAENHDYKTELQEYLQRDGAKLIEYSVTGEKGPDHDKTFDAQVSVNGKVIGAGSGRSKKAAEQSAARSALENFRK